MNESAKGAGFVVAMPAEAKSLTDTKLRAGQLRPLDGGAWLAVCGVGQHAARKAADQLVSAGVTGLVSWGTAGGLCPRLSTGDVVLPRRVVADRGEQGFDTDPEWRGQLVKMLSDHIHIDEGTLLSSPILLGSRAAKDEAFKRHGATAVDMESGAIAAVAAEAGIPFIVVRVIIDAADHTLPRTAAVAVDESGNPRIGRICVEILRRPADVPALAQLGLRLSRAQRALRLIATIAGATLRHPVLKPMNLEMQS